MFQNFHRHFQDEFALRSHTLANTASEKGLLTDRLMYKVPGNGH